MTSLNQFRANNPFNWRHTGLTVLSACLIVATANAGFHDRLLAIYP